MPAPIRTVPPLGYIDTLALVADAAALLTDSGGLQEEATALGVPCLTMRPNTERPITVEEGSSVLVGSDVDRLDSLVDSILDGEYPVTQCPELRDGRAGERIGEILAVHLGVAIRRPARRTARVAA